MTPQLQKDGQPYQIETTETACPDCGVVQEVQVMCQRYINQPPSHYVNRECPVCGFDDVWFG